MDGVFNGIKGRLWNQSKDLFFINQANTPASGVVWGNLKKSSQCVLSLNVLLETFLLLMNQNYFIHVKQSNWVRFCLRPHRSDV